MCHSARLNLCAEVRRVFVDLWESPGETLLPALLHLPSTCPELGGCTALPPAAGDTGLRGEVAMCQRRFAAEGSGTVHANPASSSD